MESESSVRTEFRELSEKVEDYKERILRCKSEGLLIAGDLDKVLEELVKESDATLKYHGVSEEIRTLVNIKR